MRWAVAAVGVLFAAATLAAEPQYWLRNGKPTRQAQQMTQILGEAQRYGLSPDSYRSRLSAAQLQSIAAGNASPELLNRYDQELSESGLRFVSHLRHGRIAPRAAGFDLPKVRAGTDKGIVEQLADSDDLEATLASLEPRAAPYRLLKQALARYRQLVQDRAIEALPALPGHSVKPGDVYTGTAQLRRQLILLDDLPATADPMASGTMDADLVRGLQRFQSRHGLLPDGVLGPQTLAALNIPMQQRVRQIELALERWRWLGVLPRPDIVINIPHFMLYALPRPARPDDRLLEIPVIVGRTQHRTPIFTASIEQVVFNPYWDVPASILRNELLPKIQKDAGYLEQHHFEIVRGAGDDAMVQPPTAPVIAALASGQFRLRQRPGPDNALGPVKFVMPNRYSIRLHGTSEPDLFDFSQRAFSHGCIRVSDPAALAEYVLANAREKWDTETIANALCGTKPRYVDLKTPVPVIIFYSTAAATVSRGVLFAPDLYGHDARLEKLLANAPES